MTKFGEWKVRSGVRIKIRSMSNDHIMNSMSMLKRFAIEQYELARVSVPVFQGEMAQMYAEQEWERLMEEGDYTEFLDKKFYELQREAYRRGLIDELEMILEGER